MDIQLDRVCNSVSVENISSEIPFALAYCADGEGGGSGATGGAAWQ